MIGKYVAIMGALCIVLLAVMSLSDLGTERSRSDERPNALLRGRPAALQSVLAKLEDQVPAGSPIADPAWPSLLAQVDQSLDERNVSAAVREWHFAYAVALQSPRWEPMIEVGDAALRISTVIGGRTGFEGKAREAYMLALVRARRSDSPDGTLRVADAFAGLGDRDTAEQVRRISERRAARHGPDAF